MFTAVLFTVAKTWKQPKCPLTGDWIKNKIMPFAATWMEPGTLILSEVSQKGKDKYHMVSVIFGI